MVGGEIVWNDVVGCTQLIADKINLNDVRLTKCGGDPSTDIPESTSLAMTATGLVALFSLYRRKNRKSRTA